MKAREMVAEACGLTWDNVAAVLREGAPDGFTTSEIAEKYGVDYVKAGAVLRAMFDAGACARVQTGKTTGTTLYFAPTGG